jgi:quinol monooxygenase YgiN
MSGPVTGTISLHGWISVSPDELPRLRPLLDEHVRLTRAEPGCLAFSVMPHPGDPGRLDVAERFRDRAAFDAHQARTAASAWGAATRHLVRHYRIEEEA